MQFGLQGIFILKNNNGESGSMLAKKQTKMFVNCLLTFPIAMIHRMRLR